jgi:hypothetical protein
MDEAESNWKQLMLRYAQTWRTSSTTASLTMNDRSKVIFYPEASVFVCGSLNAWLVEREEVLGRWTGSRFCE